MRASGRLIVVIATFEDSVLLQRNPRDYPPLWYFPQQYVKTSTGGTRSAGRKMLRWRTRTQPTVERFHFLKTIGEMPPTHVFTIELTAEEGEFLRLGNGNPDFESRLFPLAKLDQMRDLKEENRLLIQKLAEK